MTCVDVSPMPCADRRSHANGRNEHKRHTADSRRLVCPKARAGRGIYRTTSRGGDFYPRARKPSQAEPASFCTCFQAFLRPTTPSLPYDPANEPSPRPVAAIDAAGDANRRADWLSRNEFVHQGIPQIFRNHAKRVSASTAGLAIPAALRARQQLDFTGLSRDDREPGPY